MIQVSQNDPERMNLALNNTENAIKYYSGKGESIEVEIVAYGPGLNMLREDTSPVKDRIKALKASNVGGDVPLPRLPQHADGYGEARGPSDRDHYRG